MRSFSRNAAFLSVANGTAGLGRALYSLLLANLLGPVAYGIYAYGQSWYLAFLPLTLHATDSTLSVLLATRKNNWRQRVAEGFSLRCIASAVAALVCALFGVLTAPAPETALLLPVFALALLARSISMWSQAGFVAQERSDIAMRQEIIFRLLEIMTGAAWLLLGGGLVGIVIIHAAAWCCQALRGLYLVHREVTDITWSWPRWQFLLGGNAMLILAGLAGSWLMLGPLILFGQLTNINDQLGPFAMAMQLLFLVALIPWAVAQAALPPLSRAVSKASGHDRRFAETVPRIAILVGTALTLGALALGPAVIELLLGSHFAVTGQLLGPLMLVLIPLSISHALAQLFIASHRLRTHLFSATLGAVGMTLTLPPLVTWLGATGATIAAGFGFGLWCSAQWLALSRHDRLNWRLALLRPGLVAVSALSSYALFDAQGMPLLAILTATLVLGAGSFAVGAITPHERQWLVRTLSRLRSKMEQACRSRLTP